MRGAIAMALVACVASTARADDAPPRVLVRAIPDQPVPRELVDTLRIYLASSATVELGEPLVATTLDARIAEASAGLAHGVLVTWLERPPAADGAYTVVVVGERDGRAAVEVGKLDGPDTSAISRLLALRIGAFLDETLTAGPASPLVAPAKAAPPTAVAPHDEARIGAIAELGAGALVGDDVGGEGSLALGVRRRAATFAVEAVAIGRLGWPQRHRGDVGDTLDVAIADLAIGARFVVTRPRLWIGAALDLGARRARADGMTADGARGAAVRWLPMLRVAVDSRLVLGSVALRATVGIERGLGAERFTVRSADLATVGLLAAVAELALSIPLDL